MGIDKIMDRGLDPGGPLCHRIRLLGVGKKEARHTFLGRGSPAENLKRLFYHVVGGDAEMPVDLLEGRGSAEVIDS